MQEEKGLLLFLLRSGVFYVLLGASLSKNAYVLELFLSLAMFFSFINVSGAYTIQTEVFPTELKGFAVTNSFKINSFILVFVI